MYVKKSNSIAFLLISLSSVIAFLPIWNNGMVTFDTGVYIVENEHIKSFTLENLIWMATAFYISNWHPLTWFSHAIDYSIYGLKPTGHVVTNLVVHILNSLLVYYVSNTIFRLIKINAPWVAALITAILFAIHPQHVEAVAWIAQRKELLCAFFMLLSIAAYLKYQQPANEHKKILYYCSVLAAVLALMSKPMAVSIPVILIILDVYPLGRLDGCKPVFGQDARNAAKKIFIEKLPFVVVSMIGCVIAFSAQGSGGSIASFSGLPLGYRIINATNSFFLYLTKWLLPINLSPFYQYENYLLTDISFVHIIPVFAFVSVFFVSAALWRKNIKYWLISFLYYAVTVLPVIGLIQIGTQAAADRYTYIPLIPFYMIAGVAISCLLASKKDVNFGVGRVVGGLLLGVLVSSLMFLTFQQTKVWKDDFVLWYYTSKQSPNSALVRHNYGLELYKLGLFDEAIKEFNMALELRQSALTFQWAGYAHFEKKEYEKAKRRLMASLKVSRDREFVDKADVLNKIAKIYMHEKNNKQAAKFLGFALAVDADNPKSLEYLREINTPH
jgi:tetratricopeptide (TPR) repeat protein